LEYNFANAMRKKNDSLRERASTDRIAGRENNDARADALWESNPRSNLRDPYANIVGWYLGKIDKHSWANRPIPAHRRIKPAKLMPKGKSARHDAYYEVKIEREAR
jgi:hypothetical protein